MNAIRIVHTYCNESLELSNYCKYLERAQSAQFKQNFTAAIGKGLFMSIIQIMYAWAYYCGAYLKQYNDTSDGGVDYNGGVILSIMLIVVLGTMNVGVGISHYQSLIQAKVAGKIAFDTIELKPKVDPNAPGSKVD